MKATDLINKIHIFVYTFGDVEIDLNNTNGTYEKITGVGHNSWVDNERKHHNVIELDHDGSYDSDDSIVKQQYNMTYEEHHEALEFTYHFLDTFVDFEPLMILMNT